MSRKNKHEGELSDQQLDRVSGGTEVRKMGTIVVEAKRQPDPKVVKMETIVVTAKRPHAEPKVVKMETIVVTAQREKPDLAGTKLAEADPKARKN